MAELKRTQVPHGTKLELVEGETVVSGLEVFEKPMRIGDVVVRMGGIGGVHTHREHRMHGYGRQLLAGSVEFMKEAGYHLSLLYGIPNFYPRFGFAPVLPGVSASMSTRDAETAQARFAVRPMQREDRPVVARIYEEMHARHTGVCVRDPETWGGFRIGAHWGDRIDAFLVYEGDEVLGYACYELDPWRCEVSEVGYRTPAIFSTLIAEMAKQALEKRVESISFHAPFDDPFLTYCRRYGCQTQLVYARVAHGMGRVIDQRGLLDRLQPLLSARAEAAGLPGGCLLFATDLGEDQLVLGDGGRDYRVRLPQWMLAQLVLGFRPVEDALFDTEAQADEGALPYLQAIFPSGYPYIYASDRF